MAWVDKVKTILGRGEPKADPAAFTGTPTLNQVLHHISRYEGLQFDCQSDDGRIHAQHFTEQFGIAFKPEGLSQLLSDTQACLRVLNEMKEQGVTEVTIPKDVVFHPLSGKYTESVTVKPTHRKPFGTVAPGHWLVVREKVGIDILINECECLIGQVQRKCTQEKGGYAQAAEARKTGGASSPRLG